MKKELVEKLKGLKVENKIGEKITLVEVINDDEISNVIIVGDNGKKYGFEFVLNKGILKFDDEIKKLVDEECEFEKVKAEELEKEEELKREKEIKIRKMRSCLGDKYDLENTICWFRGEYSFLSNMYSCPVTYAGVEYKSVEAAFHAQKDPSRKLEFVELSGTEAKRLGKTVNLRDDWDDLKLILMKRLVIAKFSQNPDLLKKLVNTGSKELVEGNFWNDVFWGVCRGRGENHLGRILMEVRTLYR